MKRFRGGLVFKAHRLFLSLNSRFESYNEEKESTPVLPSNHCTAAGEPPQEKQKAQAGGSGGGKGPMAVLARGGKFSYERGNPVLSSSHCTAAGELLLLSSS